MFAVIGAAKGFVGTVFGTIGAILALFVAGLLASEVGNMLYGFALGGPTIGEGFAEGIKGALSEHGGYMTTVPPGGYTAENIITILESAGIPVIIGSLLSAPIAEAVAPYGSLSLVDVLAPVLANILLTIIAFILLFIIVWSVFNAIAKAAKRAIERTSMAKNVDSLLGLLLGAIKGCIILWVALAVISLFSFIPWASEIIGSTGVVKWFADNNLVTMLITSGFDVQGSVKGIIEGLNTL